MTDIEYRIQQKDKAIDSLVSFIRHDSYWLTPDDIRAIENKIEELKAFINERYHSHGSPQQ